jgi:hypothetical protein
MQQWCDVFLCFVGAVCVLMGFLRFITSNNLSSKYTATNNKHKVIVGA